MFTCQVSDSCMCLCVSLRTGKQEVVQRISTVTQPSSTPQRYKSVYNSHHKSYIGTANLFCVFFLTRSTPQRDKLCREYFYFAYK